MYDSTVHSTSRDSLSESLGPLDCDDVRYAAYTALIHRAGDLTAGSVVLYFDCELVAENDAAERTRRDLNPRHPGPEPGTLSTELRALESR